MAIKDIPAKVYYFSSYFSGYFLLFYNECQGFYWYPSKLSGATQEIINEELVTMTKYD